ncbi:MAG: urease accessory protein UreD [Chromatiaceae bacterium]|nr:urease accessory protein UreD [Chromatiaceae bacterium]
MSTNSRLSSIPSPAQARPRPLFLDRGAGAGPNLAPNGREAANSPAHRFGPPIGGQTASPGWQASLELGLSPWHGRTALTYRRQRGPLSVQRPFYPEGDVCHLYLLHPPGGVVGGDGLEIQINLEADARALVTTPGATKFYRSAGDRAHQFTTLRLGSHATLEWLPQENIHFTGVRASLKTRVELTPSSRFLGWECQCLGRPALAEGFDSGDLDCQFQLWLDDRPLLLERLRVTPHSRRGAAGLRGLPVTATLLATPAGAAELDWVRSQLDEALTSGVTLLDNLLVVRYLGDSTEECRNLFTRIWAGLRPPVLGLEPCPPRIWAT